MSPMPIGEFISSQNDIKAIEYFLKRVRGAMTKISSSKFVKKIKTDSSLALLQSGSLSFIDLNLYGYIYIILNFFELKVVEELILVIVNVCSFHFLFIYYIHL